jgi:hypothetical protein
MELSAGYGQVEGGKIRVDVFSCYAPASREDKEAFLLHSSAGLVRSFI